jgi:hypothetical protein
VRRHLDGVVEETDGRGEPGRRDGGAGGRRPRGEEGGRPEEEDGPDRWAPPVGGCVRERGRGGGRSGPRGPKQMWAAAEKKKRRGKVRWAAGWVGLG